MRSKRGNRFRVNAKKKKRKDRKDRSAVCGKRWCLGKKFITPHVRGDLWNLFGKTEEEGPSWVGGGKMLKLGGKRKC